MRMRFSLVAGSCDERRSEAFHKIMRSRDIVKLGDDHVQINMHITA